MTALKMIAVAGLAATVLTGCSTGSKPIAGTQGKSGQPVGHGKIDDPRTSHLKCLREQHLPAVKVGQTGLQLGPLPDGPTVLFAPTAGAAQELQISGQVQGAEVIGSALLYPNHASNAQLKRIEDCLAEGVSG
jgi:hypothetical protein